jgi:hypothetical protein
MSLPISKTLPSGWRLVTTHFDATKDEQALLQRSVENITRDGNLQPGDVMLIVKDPRRTFVAVRGAPPVTLRQPPRVKNPGQMTLHDGIMENGLLKEFRSVAKAHTEERALRAWIAMHRCLDNCKIPVSLRWTRKRLGCHCAHGGHRKPKPKAA